MRGGGGIWHVLGRGEVHNITVVGRLEGGRPLERPRRRMEDNISGA